jgi:hypothetical protein
MSQHTQTNLPKPSGNRAADPGKAMDVVLRRKAAIHGRKLRIEAVRLSKHRLPGFPTRFTKQAAFWPFPPIAGFTIFAQNAVCEI